MVDSKQYGLTRCKEVPKKIVHSTTNSCLVGGLLSYIDNGPNIKTTCMIHLQFARKWPVSASIKPIWPMFGSIWKCFLVSRWLSDVSEHDWICVDENQLKRLKSNLKYPWLTRKRPISAFRWPIWSSSDSKCPYLMVFRWFRLFPNQI